MSTVPTPAPAKLGARATKRRSPPGLSRRGKITLYVVLIFWTLVVLSPIYWVAITSIKLPIDVNAGPVYLPGVDYQPTLDAWDWALNTERNQTRRAFVNTVVVGVVSAVITVAIGAMASYGLARMQYRPRLASVAAFIGAGIFAVLLIVLGFSWPTALLAWVAIFAASVATWARRYEFRLSNDDIAFWLISQRLLPPIAIVLPLFIFFQQIGLLDTQLALIIAYVGANVPIAIWLLRDFFANIPIDLEEAAAIEGATRFQVLRKIILPLAVPGLMATFLFVLVFAWNEFLMASVLSSADAQTMPLLVVSQNATRGPQWWNMSALIIIMSVPVIGIAVFLERYIARGLLAGGVKF